MSLGLVRFAIRQAALAAVCPPLAPDAAPPDTHPTLAERRWYDSLMSAFDDLAQDQRRPVGIIGTTDSTLGEKGERTGIREGGFGAVTLVFHLAIAALAYDEAAEAWLPSRPVTDAELEASLDLFEHQVIRAVVRSKLVRQLSPWGVREVRSIVDRDEESGVRLAGRRVEMDVSAYDDADLYDAAGPTTLLMEIAATMPAGSRQRVLLETMAETAAAPASAYDHVIYDIRLALDLGSGDPERTDVSVAITTDPDDTTPDPRDLLDTVDPEPEGPREETDPRPLDQAPRT